MNTATMHLESALVNATAVSTLAEVEELTLDTLSLVGGGCDPYNML